MIDVSGQTLDLPKLSAELTAAGVEHRALGTRNNFLHTYNEAGEIIELPKEALVVVRAHQPSPPEPSRDEKIAILMDAGIAEIEKASTIAGVKQAHVKVLLGLKELFARGGV